jgi:sporulation protein YlmC with PRC-barrel domain
MIRAADLAGRNVRSESGADLGHIFEIQIKDGKVETLICGERGFWQRLFAARGGHRIAWNRVRRVGKEILIAD